MRRSPRHSGKGHPGPSSPDALPVSPGEALAAGLLIALFLLLTLSHFRSPGIIYDTLSNETQAARWAEALRGGARLADLPGFGESPLYHGRVTSHLMLPYFYVFGRGWAQLRLWPAAFGALTLLLTYLFCRRGFRSPAVALAALGLLAAHPSFVSGVKAGAYHVSSMVFFSTAAAFGLLRWWQTGKGLFLFLAMASTGVGIGTRLWFVWFAAALFASALAFAGELRRRFPPAKLLAHGGLALAAFLAGAWPVVRTEYRHGFSSLGDFLDTKSIFVSGEGGGRVLEAFRGFHSMLENGVFFQQCYFHLAVPQQAANALYPWLFWAAVLWALHYALFRRPAPHRGLVAWLLTVVALMLAQSFASKSAPRWHFFVLYPFPQVLMAFAAVDALAFFRRRRLALVATAALCAALAAGEARSLREFFRRLDSHGALRKSTDAVHDAAAWLGARDRPPDTLLLIVPDVFHTLYLGYPSLGLDPARHLTAEVLPNPSHLERVALESLVVSRAGGKSHEALLAEAREFPFPVLDDFASAASDAWESLVRSGRYGEVLFLLDGEPAEPRAADAFHFYRAASWAAARGRAWRLEKLFLDKDGVPALAAYSLSLPSGSAAGNRPPERASRPGPRTP
jgi:hypothetical protein